MINRVKRKKYGYIFFLGYFMFLFFQIFFVYSEIKYIKYIDTLKELFELTIYILFIIKIIKSKYTIKQIFIILFIGSMFSISAYFSRNTLLIKHMIVILAAKDIKFREIVKFDLIIKTIFIILVIVMSLLGFLNNYALLRKGSDIYRLSMGFQHPNTLAALAMSICYEWIYLRYEKLRSLDYLVVISIMLLTSNISDSRTSMYSLVILLIITLYTFSDNLKYLNMFL